MTAAWSWYVIALVLSNILGCVWLIWWTGQRKPGDPGPTDTSHIWDGDLTEYNKPMPRWWINLFYITIVFGLGYLIYYPGMGAFAGTSKWTSAKEQAADKKTQDEKLAATFRQYAGQPIDRLAADPRALKLGRSIFNQTCSTCHGSSAQGATGYPNLTDRIWHWGSSPDEVLQTVVQGRTAVMPAWGSVLTGMGGDNAVTYVTAYVHSLSRPSGQHQANLLADRGKPLYEGVCAACHGVAGKGNQKLGAPDLTDTYWLYGDSNEAVTTSIVHGRNGSMPAHGNLLGDTRSRLVAAYVWSLSHPSGTATE